jgi:stearoyl-CoA desaturase (Delta-9 desaturase)
MTQFKNSFLKLLAWFDTSSHIHDKNIDTQNKASSQEKSISLVQLFPFAVMHLGVFGLFWVGFSWVAFWVAIALYVIRMFAITGFYHRYFSHKHFKTSRPVQFIFAFIGATSAQRGPLWWASHHRVHHSFSDKEQDPHSPRHLGFIWSHCLWFLSSENFSTRKEKIKDFSQFPELRWLDRFDFIAPLFLLISLYVVGLIIENYYSNIDVTAGQLIVWGFFVSTIALYHATYTINSLAHQFGTRRFDTKDDSRNNAALAILTLGEGWHNNHHYYAGSVRQGFVWWEIDMTFYLLKLMSWFGLVWDLKPIPERIKLEISRGSI